LFSLPFLLGYQILCVVNALINGEIEDYVWFEDMWMVSSWCDGSHLRSGKFVKNTPHLPTDGLGIACSVDAGVSFPDAE
jgi:hypothetical protein